MFESIMNLIKDIVGKLTRPDYLFVDEAGVFWIEGIHDHPNPFVHTLKYVNYDNPEGSLLSYPFNYTKVVQNEWGKWEIETCYLGKLKELPLMIGD
jgi:hypothetical protein